MKKILIVDDALFMREVIRGMLASGGFTDTLDAADGHEAVSVYREQRPDLVLLDITMPNMDGIEALGRLMELDPAAKVVMCSAIGQEKQMMRAVSLGAADYIVKPFKTEGLLKTVKKVLYSQN